MASPIREAALSMERIDTHSHLDEALRGLDEEARNWAHFPGNPELSSSRITAIGCRALHGIDVGTYLRPDSPAEVFQAAAALRAQGGQAAIARALDAARIRTQLTFTDTKADAVPFPGLRPRVRYLAYIDAAINGHNEWPCPDQPFASQNYYDNLCQYLGPLGSLDDYLAALDMAVDSWRAKGVVGLKTAIAYTSGLAISDPSPQQARLAFSRKQAMNEAEFRDVHDFAFRHVLEACRRNHLPVVVHTGFLIWGHANVAQANPLHLHNLLIDRRYSDLTFVLLHGGFPYIGQTTYLAGMFPRVVIDFTWVAYLSRPRFRLALAEWLEAVPSDRICWGSDSSSPESIVGVDRLTRSEIARVLEDMIADGMLDEKAAMAALENLYVNTAQRVFGL